MRAPIVVVCVLAAAALAPAPSLAADPPPRASLTDIEDEVMCIVCGVPLELATESPQAEQERDLIRKLIAEGKTKDEIKDALVAQYGADVLATPGDSGFDLAAWLVPGLGILIAAVAILVGVRRWRRGPPPDGGGTVQPPSSEADRERLDEDLARYRL